MATTTTPTTPTPTRPCRCWVEIWSAHEGHCCFAVGAPEDCHDTEGATLSAIHRRGRNGLGGPAASRTYWLTRRGWLTALLAEHPSLGRPLGRSS